MERRIKNTDYIMTENHRLNNLKQSVDDEWNHVMSEQKNIEQLVEKKLEERENFLRMPPFPPASNHIDLMNIGQAVRARGSDPLAPPGGEFGRPYLPSVPQQTAQIAGGSLARGISIPLVRARGALVRAALDPFGVDVDVSIETPAKKPRSERATEMDQAQKEKVDKAREAKENMTSEATGR